MDPGGFCGRFTSQNLQDSFNLQIEGAFREVANPGTSKVAKAVEKGSFFSKAPSKKLQKRPRVGWVEKNMGRYH